MFDGLDAHGGTGLVWRDTLGCFEDTRVEGVERKFLEDKTGECSICDGRNEGVHVCLDVGDHVVGEVLELD